MKIDLHYGAGLVNIEIPEQNLAQTIQPWIDPQPHSNQTIIASALTEEKTADFRQRIAGKRLCLLTNDGTRDMPLADIFEKLFPLLAACSFVRFIISTGTHNSDTPENKKIATDIVKQAKKASLTQFDIHVHNCKTAEFTAAGTTSHSTNVLVNAKIDTAEAFCVLSDVKFHYFAGYSNPIKYFVPGLCAYETTEKNHSLALDDRSTYGLHPWHKDKNRRDNPLATDQAEAMRLITKDRPVFALTSISSSGKIQWACLDTAKNAASKAFDIVDEKNTRTVAPTEYLIVSPGGLPNDIDLYIAQRALELTKQAVKDNGEILFISACPKGVGEEKTMQNFYDPLTRPIDEIRHSTEQDYKLYSHKPYKFAKLIQRLKKIWVYSELPDKTVKAAHLYPTPNPQAVVDNWIKQNPLAKITVVDGANKIAIY